MAPWRKGQTVYYNMHFFVRRLLIELPTGFMLSDLNCWLPSST
jgi:hypothetical protein